MLRIRDIRKARGLTIRELAEVIGTTEVSMSRYEREPQRLTLPILERLAEALDTRIGVLIGEDLLADGEELGRDSGSLNKKFHDNSNTAKAKSDSVEFAVALPEVDVRASAGAGAVVDDEQTRAVWSFPRYWLLSEFGGSTARDFRIITVEGDSMLSDPPGVRDLLPGDKVVIDVADRTPSPPGIFVVHDGLGLVAKRVEFVPDSEPPTIRISSNNDSYAAYERTLGEAHIMGRVVGRWQRL